MLEIIDIRAREILDSRGWPSVEVDVRLSDGSIGRAAVPSGASTGAYEACELRDKDKCRFMGKGTLKAVENINGEIFNHLVGHPADNQRLIDELLIRLDGTENKCRLGANAILGVSLAVARGASLAFHMPLYRYLGGINAHILPIPMINILNGGLHADNGLGVQEFMIMPVGATDFREAIRMGSEIFHALQINLKQGGYSTAVGDEGGFAPSLKSTTAALDFLMKAIDEAGYSVGSEIMLALDAAATSFYYDGYYQFPDGHKKFTTAKMITYWENLVKSYPILSLEDPLTEDDWTGWQQITRALGDKVWLVGDDLFVTNINRFKQGIEKKVANTILIKPNQIGTLTETLNTILLAQKSGYRTIVSHRSGETEDTFIADLCVATNCGVIKAGSLSRSERLAKYNQLLRIGEELGPASRYAGQTGV